MYKDTNSDALETVGAFEMNRILSKHIFAPDEMDGSQSSSQTKNEIVDDDGDDDDDDDDDGADDNCADGKTGESINVGLKKNYSTVDDRQI